MTMRLTAGDDDGENNNDDDNNKQEMILTGLKRKADPQGLIKICKVPGPVVKTGKHRLLSLSRT